MQVDVVIIGGGMVGLLQALMLAQQHFRVAIIENKQPGMVKNGLDARVSAINTGSQNILKNLGLWADLDEKTFCSLQRLLVWDGLGGAELEFNAADLAQKELGCIIENRELIQKIWHALEKHSLAKLIIDTPTKLQIENNFIEITCDSGHTITAALCIGADGANSWLRKQAQIEYKEKFYEQNAIIAVVETAEKHQHTGWQVFLTQGPLALLPLADLNHCAIVWSTAIKHAEQLMAMSETEFNLEMNNVFGSRLGDIKLLSERRSFPLISRHAKNYVLPRIALIGDAAHSVHPLAGQGVNLGFYDAACLTDCIRQRSQYQDIGHLKILRRYERWRKGANQEMILMLNGLHHLFANDSSLLVLARNEGFNLIERSHFLKNSFMQIAMGERKDSPQLATLIPT